jgi:V/A-type H+-transporting ATPase subunit I
MGREHKTYNELYGTCTRLLRNRRISGIYAILHLFYGNSCWRCRLRSYFSINYIICTQQAKFKPRIEFTLVYILSISIMFWGILTGTYFGSEQIAEIPFLSALIVDRLASFGGDDIFIQKFMFIVGAIHLSIGHIQTGLRYINSVKAIAQVGWVAIIWGLYLVVNQMVLGEPAPAIMPWLFAGGTLLIALFSNPGTNFVKGVVRSVGGLPLSLISGFSDIISYIRLYAVGLATVLMALSFNQMAIGDGITTVLSGIGAVIVLILGHGLNMILAAMAVIVHGVRLNMLEYAGHAGVEFSGDEYNPFKIKIKN